MLLPAGIHADDDQGTQPVVLGSEPAINPIDPDLHPRLIINPSLTPDLIFLTPDLLQAGHRAGGETLRLWAH